MNIPYKQGKAPAPNLPLARFIPPIPAGMISSWCEEILDENEWVLEPFGFNPLVPIEIAQSGHPVLVAANNPIHAFMLQVIASAPQQEEFVAALQDLAVAEKGEERMEPYIRSFYQVTCLDCSHPIEADAFLWKKGADQPYASIVDCPFCGARGEQALSPSSLENLKKLPSKQLHFARALNRIADINDPIRSQVENALNAYPTRPLIILQTLINRLETLEQTPRRRELSIALILSAADQGNTLWAYPSPRERPRQIVVPSVYQEKNLWKALEEAMTTWQVIENPIPLSIWQGKPDEPQGIYLFPGRFRELELDTNSEYFSAVITAIPRPNQAFWTLSALWSGWFWGKEAVMPIRQMLSRQRYDWNWHTNALGGVFDTIHTLASASKKVLGLVAENEPMLLLAALLAADEHNFQLLKFAQSIDDQIAQCQWERNLHRVLVEKPEPAQELAKQKIKNYLTKKGEPASFQQIHAAAITGLAAKNSLALDIFLENPNQAASETQKWLETLFLAGGELLRIDNGGASIDTGEWWLVDPVDVDPPLIDQVEEQVIRYLLNHQRTTAHDLKDYLYKEFPGIFTPEDDLVRNCLESYTDLMDQEAHLWQFRDSEQPAKRRSDIAAIQTALKQIAVRLNYKVTENDPMLWQTETDNKPAFSFQVFSSAIISRHIGEGIPSATVNVLVLPASRLNLLAFKQQRNPLLRNLLAENYLVVKFSLIRDLQANPLLTRELFMEQIQVSPPEYQSSQLALF